MFSQAEDETVSVMIFIDIYIDKNVICILDKQILNCIFLIYIKSVKIIHLYMNRDSSRLNKYGVHLVIVTGYLYLFVNVNKETKGADVSADQLENSEHMESRWVSERLTAF